MTKSPVPMILLLLLAILDLILIVHQANRITALEKKVQLLRSNTEYFQSKVESQLRAM